jgi:5-methylcytosine-specific restriction protein B
LVNATKKLIGYQLNGHLPFALVREEKTVTAFAPVGAWTKACAELIKRRYEPSDPRHSNLTSCCPQAGQGHAAVALKIGDEAAFDKFVAALEGKESLDSLDPAAEEEKLDNAMPDTQVQQPLNQILYGPPGTGKTYFTIDAALEILDPGYLGLHLEDRTELKARFDQLSKEQRIRFVTFHQSFSYEDFVEGLRAHSQDGTLQYRVEPGVFLQLCEAARRAPAGKKTLDGALDDFLEELAKQSAELTTVQGKVFRASYRPGHDTVICFPQSSQTGMPSLPNIENIRAVLRGEEPENLSLPSYVHGIANYVRARFQAQLGKTPGARSDSTLPYVLIIDEINRGNISRVFGELITLIEPSKRAGCDEALEVVLPYSKLPFSVPKNVYLIGTMNTADRSLTGMDVALRRRFMFKEMPPRPDLLDEVLVGGVIPMGQLLRVLNQRIEALLDRDHCLGHANFMPLRETPTIDCLAQVFRNQVLPLLQEYFFDDWQRIQWVLNDHRKPAALRFVDSTEVDKARLFGRDAEVNVAAGARTWTVNEAAFRETASYLATLGPQAGSSDQA